MMTEGIPLALGLRQDEGGEATRQRMASGQGDKAKAGFQLWLDGGGRDLLSKMATNRARRKRWLKEQVGV